VSDALELPAVEVIHGDGSRSRFELRPHDFYPGVVRWCLVTERGEQIPTDDLQAVGLRLLAHL
jgi:hypothetical protein